MAAGDEPCGGQPDHVLFADDHVVHVRFQAAQQLGGALRLQGSLLSQRFHDGAQSRYRVAGPGRISARFVQNARFEP